MLTKVNAAQGRFANDEGRLPYISPSARIYDAELNIKYGMYSIYPKLYSIRTCVKLT